MDLISFTLALLAGILIGMFSERHRLHEFVERERESAKQERLRADRAVDQLVLQSGGTPISAWAQEGKEQREESDVSHQEDLNEIYADETGEYRGPEEPPK